MTPATGAGTDPRADGLSGSLMQRERSQCALNWHLLFAEIVYEITLHPRPASRGFAGDVETDHPHGSPHRFETGSAGRCRTLWSFQTAGTPKVRGLTDYNSGQVAVIPSQGCRVVG